MATALAPRTSTRFMALPTSTSPRCAHFNATMLAVPTAMRRAAPVARKSRASSTIALAFHDHSYWGGRSSQRRGAWRPFKWQVGGPMVVETLEDLVKEFGCAPNTGPGKAQRRGRSWSEFANQACLPLDVEEQESRYLITADVPGLQKSDLKITVNPSERSLTVSGERQRPENPASQNQESFRQRLERRMGKFERTLPSLPEGADLSAVSARVTNGVLTISIKKSEEQQPAKTVDIDID